MGDHDSVTSDDPRFRCSEGHDLTQELFQTKDLGCTMGTSSIAAGRLKVDSGNWGEPPALPFSGCIRVYRDCRRCPAFVQAGTFNVVATFVEFEVTIVADAVRSIERIGQSTAEFVDSAPRQPWLAGCLGPMSYDQACRVQASARR